MRGQQKEGREEQTSFSLIRFQVEPRAAFIGGTGGQHVCCLIARVQCKLFARVLHRLLHFSGFL